MVQDLSILGKDHTVTYSSTFYLITLTIPKFPLRTHYVSINHKFIHILVKTYLCFKVHYLSSIMSPLCILFTAYICISFNLFSHLKCFLWVKGWRNLNYIWTKNAWSYFQFQICKLGLDNIVIDMTMKKFLNASGISQKKIH